MTFPTIEIPDRVLLTRSPPEARQRVHDVAEIFVPEDGDPFFRVRMDFHGGISYEDESGVAFEVATAEDRNVLLDVKKLREDLRSTGPLGALLREILDSLPLDADEEQDFQARWEEVCVDFEEQRYEDSHTEVWEASLWLGSASLSDLGLTAKSTPEEVDAAVKDCETQAKKDGVVIVGSIEKVIEKMLERAREDADEDGDE